MRHDFCIQFNSIKFSLFNFYLILMVDSAISISISKYEYILFGSSPFFQNKLTV